jgi:sorbitol-specific phosphotransferase system component IIA
MSPSDICDISAIVKRNTDLGSGRKGAPVTHISSLLVSPLYPAGEGTIRTLNLNSPREAKECYHCPGAGETLPDVKEGDFLVVGSATYPIRFVGEWLDEYEPVLHIVVTEVKT